MLFWNYAQPGCKITTLAESSSVADGGDDCSGCHRTKPWYSDQSPTSFILPRNLRNRIVGPIDLLSELRQLLFQLHQQHTQGSRQLRCGICENFRQSCIHVPPSLAQSDAALQQQSTDLIDDGGPTHHPALTYSM